jgi:ADP-heptose:LPS heptosyltransferase
MDKPKFLLIRFSSFGDVVQFLSVASAIKAKYPDAIVHWVTRKDYAEIGLDHPHLDKIWGLDRTRGSKALFQLISELKKQNYTHIYDGHNNLRSHIVCWALNGPLGLKRLWKRHLFLRRSQYRWRRLLLFCFGINLYPKPFVGQWALLEPLKRWGIQLDIPPTPQIFFVAPFLNGIKEKLGFFGDSPFVTLVPSASHELKRWPVEYWQELIKLSPNVRFVVLGGPHDHFTEEIVQTAPDRCLNLAGKLSYRESAAVVALTEMVVANDTGLMHVAEQLGKPCIALMGPAPFGYPGRKSTLVKERNLKCRPCSKHGQGPCINKEYQACLRDIKPQEIYSDMKRLIHV